MAIVTTHTNTPRPQSAGTRRDNPHNRPRRLAVFSEALAGTDPPIASCVVMTKLSEAESAGQAQSSRDQEAS